MTAARAIARSMKWIESDAFFRALLVGGEHGLLVDVEKVLPQLDDQEGGVGDAGAGRPGPRSRPGSGGP